MVENEDKLLERVGFIHDSIGTDAIVDQYIEGRELYVGVMGNARLQVFPVWELDLTRMPEDARRIATDRVKWSQKYQKKHGIRTHEATNLVEGTPARVQHLAKRVYRALQISGYARIDFRLDEGGKIYVLEANPNPQIAYGEDFAESAEHGGMSYEGLLQRILTIGLQWEPSRTG